MSEHTPDRPHPMYDESLLATLRDEAFPGVDDETGACLIADSETMFIEWSDVEPIVEQSDAERVVLLQVVEAAKKAIAKWESDPLVWNLEEMADLADECAALADFLQAREAEGGEWARRSESEATPAHRPARQENPATTPQ